MWWECCKTTMPQVIRFEIECHRCSTKQDDCSNHSAISSQYTSTYIYFYNIRSERCAEWNVNVRFRHKMCFRWNIFPKLSCESWSNPLDCELLSILSFTHMPHTKSRYIEWHAIDSHRLPSNPSLTHCPNNKTPKTTTGHYLTAMTHGWWLMVYYTINNESMRCIRQSLHLCATTETHNFTHAAHLLSAGRMPTDFAICHRSYTRFESELNWSAKFMFYYILDTTRKRTGTQNENIHIRTHQFDSDGFMIGVWFVGFYFIFRTPLGYEYKQKWWNIMFS